MAAVWSLFHPPPLLPSASLFSFVTSPPISFFLTPFSFPLFLLPHLFPLTSSLFPSSFAPSSLLHFFFSYSLHFSLLPLSTLLSFPPLSQVLQLLTEHDGNDDREVADMKAKVESLLASYRLIEDNGHRELNHIRGIASSLEWEWTRFYSDMEQRHKNLHLSLSFQDYLFEVSRLAGNMFLV